MFYQNVQKYAKLRGTTPTGVANAIGLANSSATKWKRGSVPNADNVQKIAEFLNVPIEALLQDDYEMPVNYASNISNSAVIQGNNGDNVQAFVGNDAVVSSADPNEAELIRIYRSLSMRDRLKLMQQAYDLEDGANM